VHNFLTFCLAKWRLYMKPFCCKQPWGRWGVLFKLWAELAAVLMEHHSDFKNNDC
jgi:hypothetical protein